MYDMVCAGSMSCFNNCPSGMFLYKNFSWETASGADTSTVVATINFTEKSVAIIIAMLRAVRKYNKIRPLVSLYLYHLKIQNANAIVIMVANPEVMAFT